MEIYLIAICVELIIIAYYLSRIHSYITHKERKHSEEIIESYKEFDDKDALEIRNNAQKKLDNM
jgi:hypothetical protein